MSADVGTGRGGLYATYFDPTGWWVNAGVWGGYNSYSTSRQAPLGPANASTDGYEISAFGEAGYNFHCGDLSWGPLVAMQFTDVHVSGFSEHGSLVPLGPGRTFNVIRPRRAYHFENSEQETVNLIHLNRKH